MLVNRRAQKLPHLLVQRARMTRANHRAIQNFRRGKSIRHRCLLVYTREVIYYTQIAPFSNIMPKIFSDSISFSANESPLGALFKRALDGLRANIRPMQGFDVLIEGAEYNGIWLECGPHEASLYAELNPSQLDVAVASHRAFWAFQRDDGYLPCYIWPQKLGSAQIQSVVPIAETAWRTWLLCGDAEFLRQSYAACARWDAWLGRWRDTRATGLCEAFCEYDTGHDRSPRFRGFPRECPDNDARVCPDAPGAPFVAPDLSASRMGGQRALARMARALNLGKEADDWDARAATMRQKIIETCYDDDETCFFDVEASGDFVRIRGDVLARVLDEGVPDQALFETIYARQIRDENAFWTPFPLPSIAADDALFDRDIPHNSWGGASQALTAMRAPRWFVRYGKEADLAHLMERWLSAIAAYGAFSQQMNPWTGAFDGQGNNYSPAMLLTLDFVTRLHGVRRENGAIKWGCGLPAGARDCVYQADFSCGKMRLAQNRNGALLERDGDLIARVEGRCQIVTGEDGALQTLVGTVPELNVIEVHWPNGTSRRFDCSPDEKIRLEAPFVAA